MTQIIPAIYTNGVFKPLARVKLPNRKAVRIAVTDVDLDQWNKKWDAVLKAVHRRTGKFPSKEIESDITAAFREIHK